MNILIPHNWLLEHLDTKATPKQIQEYLSLCGPSVERIETVKGEPVYDIEVTTNRVDMMSVRGITREAATILPEFGIDAKLKKLSRVEISSTSELNLKIKNDSSLCHRSICVLLKDVQIKDSPDWIKKRLEQVGQRPLNNAIDITNYAMWEVGHPIHAFDYDRLKQKTIVIREARKGEKLTTLDEKTHVMKGGEVVFGDGKESIIDLPGIMGTKNTVVTKDTKNVLLWIESIDAVKIRMASMSHAIRSQAAILNEKNVDPELALPTLIRGIELYQKVANAKIGSKIKDIYPKKPKENKISLSQKHLDVYMGLEIKPKRVVRILENLGCKVTHDQEKYIVVPPTSRSRDMTIYQDVIEEIARIYGYHNLPSVVMDTPIPDNPPEEDFAFERKIKNWLAGWGVKEIYTYSMVSEEKALESSYKIEDHLKIKNPLTDDMIYMRRSLIPSLAQVIKDNQQSDLTIFEMQNVYHPSKPSELPTEELQLVIASNKSYKHLKGVLDNLLDKLYITNVKIRPEGIKNEPLNTNASGTIHHGKSKLGVIGQVKNTNLYIAKLTMKDLQNNSRTHPKYIPVITTPPVVEDLTFTLKENTYLGQLIEEVYLTSKLVEQVVHKDTYNNNYTLTITYRHSERPLTDKEIAPIRKKIVNNLLKSFKASLVGTL
ncbi:phenylalanine--tRNA ligase subunit beta [Patescibacteria group bacterium]